MMIDKILDRKDGVPYSPRALYNHAMAYEQHDIASALDSGTEQDVQRTLCNYIDDNEYNPTIKEYIVSVSWIQ